jgi:hypothetical protein
MSRGITTEGDSETGLVLEVLIAAPRDVVRPWLTDPELIRRWHGWDYDGLREEIRTIYVDGAHADAETGDLRLDSHDVFRVEEHEDGTCLRLTRPPRGLDPDHDEWYPQLTEGWISFLAQLRFAVEEQPHQERRTIWLSTDGEHVDHEELATRAPARLGESWFTSAHQAGWVLPELGPGLLVLADSPLGAPGATATVSTYGLDAPAFAEQVDRWTTWWRSAHPEAPDATTSAGAVTAP